MVMARVVLSLGMVSVDRDGMPEWSRKGKGVPHYLRTQPPVLGSVSVDTVCGNVLGRSSDVGITFGSGVVEGVCRNCVRVWERLSAVVTPVEPVAVPVEPVAVPVAVAAPEGPVVDPAEYVQWWEDVLLHGALVDVMRIKIRAARVADSGRAVAIKRGRRAVQGQSPAQCVHPEEGEPVKVKHRVVPIDGSVRELVAGEFRGGTVKHAVRSGTCPFCTAHVPLSGTGFVTAHVRGAESVPAPKGKLTDAQTIPVDTGARVGDPEGGDKRRGLDVDGSFERGMVPGHDPETLRPIKDASGHQIDVPATAVNVRAVLEYWKRKRINRPKDGAKPEAFDRWRSRQANQSARVLRYTRMLRAYEGAGVPRYDKDAGAYVVPPARNVPLFDYDETSGEVTHTGERDRVSVTAQHSPDGLVTPHTQTMVAPSPVSGAPLAASQALPGPASYRGRALPTMAGPVTVSQVGDAPVDPAPCEDTRTGWESRAGTQAGPLGAERMDREVVGDRPRAKHGTAKSANYRKKMRRLAAQGLVPVKGALKPGEWSRGLSCGHLSGQGCTCPGK